LKSSRRNTDPVSKEMPGLPQDDAQGYPLILFICTHTHTHTQQQKKKKINKQVPVAAALINFPLLSREESERFSLSFPQWLSTKLVFSCLQA